MNYLFRLLKLKSAINSVNIKEIIKALNDKNIRIRKMAIDHICEIGDCQIVFPENRPRWITECSETDLQIITNAIEDIIEKWNVFRSGLEDEIIRLDIEYKDKKAENIRHSVRQKLHKSNVNNQVLSYLIKILFKKTDIPEIIKIIKRESENYGAVKEPVEIEYHGRFHRTYISGTSYDEAKDSIKDLIKDGWHYDGRSGNTDNYSWEGFITTDFNIPIPVS